MNIKNIFKLESNPESYFSGVIQALWINIILWLIALSLWFVLKDISYSIIGTCFFLLLFFNAHMLAKGIYLAVFKRMTKKIISNSLTGEILTFSIITLLICLIASNKFNLFPVSAQSYAPVFFSVLGFSFVFLATVLNQLKAKRIGLIDAGEESPYHIIDTSSLKKWQIYFINTAFIVIPLLLAFIFISLFVKY